MKNPSNALILFGLLFIHLLILKNVTFTAWPEMFSYPYLINSGFLIYKDIAHPYVPLLSVVLASYYKIVGLNLFTNQFFTWGLILINDILIFLISKKILKNQKAFLPLIIYISLQPIFEGNMLWFDLGTTPLILGALVSFVYIKDLGRRLFWIGFLLALALLIKQQVIILVGLVSLFFIFFKETRKVFHVYFLGSLIPIFFTFLVLATLQILNDYFFWTIAFPLVWLPKFSGYSQLPATKELLILLSLFAIPVIFLLSKLSKVNTFSKLILISIIATVLMAFPRFSYFHLQPALVIITIFYALLLQEKKKVAMALLIIPVFIGFYLWKDYRPFVGVETARFYDNEDLEVSNFIKANSAVNDRVYFIGQHSLMFSLSDRLPPKPWIENYVWHFEIPGLQESQIEGFKREDNLVIFKQGFAAGNWYDLGVYKPSKILDFINQNFEMVNKSEGGMEVWKRKSD